MNELIVDLNLIGVSCSVMKQFCRNKQQLPFEICYFYYLESVSQIVQINNILDRYTIPFVHSRIVKFNHLFIALESVVHDDCDWEWMTEWKTEWERQREREGMIKKNLISPEAAEKWDTQQKIYFNLLNRILACSIYHLQVCSLFGCDVWTLNISLKSFFFGLLLSLICTNEGENIIQYMIIDSFKLLNLLWL